MDILDENFGAQSTPVDLHDLVATPIAPSLLPKGAIRNRAATTSLLASEPDQAISNYQLLMKEGEDGQSALYDKLKTSVLDNTAKVDMRGLMSVLSDPKISYEDKRAMVAGAKASEFLRDSGTILHSNSLVAGSKGENQEQESARISSADAIREIYDARNQIQGLVNAHAASLPDASVNTLGEMTALYVMPFGNTISTGKVNRGVAEAEGKPLSLWQSIKGFLLPGSATMDLRTRLEQIPPEKRVEYAKALIEGIQSSSGIIFSNENQFAQFDKATAIFDQGGYSSFQEFMDNVSPLLDVIGIGQVARGIAKTTRMERTATAAADKVHPAEWELVNDTKVPQPVPLLPNGQKRIDLEDQVKRIEMNSVVRQENPASPANIVQQANPAKARDIHDVVVKSSTDEVAEALYGTSKAQAIINDTFPQASTESGRVVSEVTDIERNLREELHVTPELVDIMENTGASYYSRGEKAEARANVVNDFSNAEGLTVNDAMSSFRTDGGMVRIEAVYGTSEGGFLKAEDALQQAKYALRSRGIRDEEITILKKSGLDYVPVELAVEVGKEGSYFARVTTSHEIDPTDIANLETFDVKRNLFDRVGPTVSQNTGSVSRYLFDAASMLHPIYTGAAAVASDATSKFDKLMLSIATEYSDKYMKLDSVRRAKMDDYIREANFQGIKFDPVDLVARGFNPNEIDALHSWRKFWDGHFYLENADVVRTLNSQGYQLFRNKNTELYVRPIAKDQTIGKLYDPATDSIVIHSKNDGDMLYDSGGTYAKLRRPTDFGGVTTEYMIVRNTPTEYTRKFRTMDQVLNYREGYFQIQYKSPKFVDEIMRDPSGKVISTKSIAVAGDTQEANFFAQRMATTTGKPIEDFVVRSDVRALQRDSDAWWDLNSSGGRIAQRHRGKLLEDASGLNHLGDGSYVLDPVDSAVRAAKSIAGRTVARPMLEAAKARFINQYGNVIPPDSFGGRRWPKNKNEITSKGKETSKEVADARTTYEYINYLENGYMNTIDNVFRTGMHAIANMLGNVNLPTAERSALWIGEGAPASLSKNATFLAYIGLNPLRQWVIQPHQIVRTFSYNPQGWLNGGIEKLAGSYLTSKMQIGYKASPEMKAFEKFIDDSGMLDSVDKQNLVRGSLMDAADSSNRVLATTKKYTTTLSRQAGFDIGEQSNLLGHAAAVYEKRTREGINLADKTARDEAYSEIRAISYDMNFAGDMPYNQTSPSVLLQFMQVPHKALLQATNRRIDPMDRLRMVGADLVMWGGPTALIGSVLGTDILPDNPKLREAFTWGMESVMLNYMFTTLSGEDTNIDFSSLAPYDMTGWGKFFTALYSGGASQAIANSPSGQLFLKDGGRVQNAIQSMSRYFGIVDDMDETPETFLSVVTETLKISSGFNDAIKAKILLDARKKFDQYGSTVDKNVSVVEAWAQLFGFGTADTRDLYRMSQEMSKDVKKHKEETIKVYNEIKRYYAEKLESDDSDPVFVTKVTGRIMQVFKDDPVALSIIANQLKSDLTGKDAALLGLFLKRSGIPNVGNLRDQVKQMPVSEEQKKLMLQRIDDVENIRTDLKKE